MKYSIFAILILSMFLIMSCEEASDPDVIKPMITLESSDATTTVGSTFSVTAKIADLPDDFFAISMRISFDSNRLTIGDDQAGWIGNLWSSSAVGLLEVESGIVYLSITQIAGSGSVSGDGIVLSLDVTAEQSGVTALDLIQSRLIFYDENGAEITMSDLEIEGVSITIE